MQEDKKELSTAKTVRAGGKVLPQEPVDIYAAASGKAAAHLGAHGTKHTVHAVLADKLIKSGAATLDTPAKKGKSSQLTKAEIKALAASLGHEPTEEEIAAAIEEKEALS